MITESILLLVILLMCFLLAVRHHIVYTITIKAIRGVDVSHTNKNFYYQMAAITSKSYTKMMFDLTKWTDRQFFPELFK
jgi:hypothetical protein